MKLLKKLAVAYGAACVEHPGLLPETHVLIRANHCLSKTKSLTKKDPKVLITAEGCVDLEWKNSTNTRRLSLRIAPARVTYARTWEEPGIIASTSGRLFDEKELRGFPLLWDWLIGKEEDVPRGDFEALPAPTLKSKETLRIQNALQIARSCGCIDGGHHKMWVIDQMVRALLGAEPGKGRVYPGDNSSPEYAQFVALYEESEDGLEYTWDTGIAP